MAPSSAGGHPSALSVSAAGPGPLDTQRPDVEALLEVPYRGTLGGEHIVLRLTQTRSVLDGRYFAERTGVDVPLKGNVQRDGRFVLTEKGSKARWNGTLRGEFLSGSRQLGDAKDELTATRVKQAGGPGWEPVFIAMKRIPPSCSDGASDVAKFEYPEFVGAFSPEHEADINHGFLPSEDFVRCSRDDYRRLEFRVLYDADGVASLERREVHFQSITAKKRAPDWSIEYQSYSLSAQKRLQFDEVFPASK